MITANIQRVVAAKAREHDDFSIVELVTENGTATLFLPIGTSAAVAACINVAVAAGAQAAAKSAEAAE